MGEDEFVWYIINGISIWIVVSLVFNVDREEKVNVNEKEW